jgi:hypothetical protein
VDVGETGFGTLTGHERVAPSIFWKKLASMREGADIA